MEGGYKLYPPCGCANCGCANCVCTSAFNSKQISKTKGIKPQTFSAVPVRIYCLGPDFVPPSEE